MTTTAADGLLRGALRANGIFSLLSGSFLFVADGLAAAILGPISAVPYVSVVGLGVFGFGIAVLWLSTRKPIPQAAAMAVVAADAVWVLCSWGLLVGASWLSDQGWWAVGIVADIVLLVAAVQWLGVRRVRAAA
jgi:hypothetical protein